MLRRILLACLIALFFFSGAFAPLSHANGTDTPEPSAMRAARLLRAARGIAPLSDRDAFVKDVNGDGTFTEYDCIAVLQQLIFPAADPARPVAPLAFVPCSEVPLPSGSIAYGQDFNLHGTVYSDSPLTAVTVAVTGDGAKNTRPLTATVTFTEHDGILQYALESSAGTKENESITEQIDFSLLPQGAYTLLVSAASTGFPEGIALSDAAFTVERISPLILTQNKFRGNYSTALGFFGYDTSKFLFPYTQGDGRSIATDAVWREANIVKTDWGRIHVDAVPYFALAKQYLDSTLVRVSGNGHDSGIVPLAALLVTTSGPYVPRFVSDLTYISHHTFGTAIDVNHKYTANLNNTENWEFIRSEVQDHLIYNGIAADGNLRFYDFTYTGSWKGYRDEIPTSLSNYLLYELAFFRAGFRWGYYYQHTCDAMHFSLTDSSLRAHSNLDTGLRKVFVYYN